MQTHRETSAVCSGPEGSACRQTDSPQDPTLCQVRAGRLAHWVSSMDAFTRTAHQQVLAHWAVQVLSLVEDMQRHAAGLLCEARLDFLPTLSPSCVTSGKGT